MGPRYALFGYRVCDQHISSLSYTRPIHPRLGHSVSLPVCQADNRLVAYPAGKFCAWLLPITTHQLPRWLGGATWSFNPGPFNIKEHAIIVIMANVAIGPAYALYATVSSELYYAKKFGAG